MAAIGIRQLRSDLAATVRRAGAGEVVDVTVDGRAVARLVPLSIEPGTAPTLAALIEAGALIAPRRAAAHVASGAISVWRNVRLDLLLREIRG